ncbi:DNA-binding protein [Candidatus Woesearchaeota archaeon B3_Woes]|nr:MAG: DNA-binding protein [Candidatus Woesearchaeota archaeon B3_Woes]
MMPKEEVAIVLDFLPNGYPFDKTPSYKKNAIVQVLGKNQLVLLELVPKKGVTLQPNEEVYIGEGKRDKIHHITGRLDMDKLTATGSSVLKDVIKNVVHKHPEKFIEFFNKAQPLTTRMHQLELLPGVGKKHMWEIIDARDEKSFESFDDIKKRVKLMPDPEKAIIRRIVSELSGQEKHRLFAAGVANQEV